MKVQALAGLLSPGTNNAPLSAIGGVDTVLAMKEYRKRNGSGAVYDDPRVAVGAGRFDEVGARAEA
jgi:hypothetical protein